MNDNRLFFFRLMHSENDPYPEYRIAHSYDDLVSQLGSLRAGSYYKITKLGEVTYEHLFAVFELLDYLKSFS